MSVFSGNKEGFNHWLLRKEEGIVFDEDVVKLGGLKQNPVGKLA